MCKGKKKLNSKFRTKGKEYSEEAFTEFIVSEFYKNKKSFRDKLGRQAIEKLWELKGVIEAQYKIQVSNEMI